MCQEGIRNANVSDITTFFFFAIHNEYYLH